MGALAPKIEGQGVLQEAWDESEWLAALPLSPAEAAIQGARRLLVVSPHPDDEVLGCAGLMQAAADLGVGVHVVSVTDGEACYPDQPLWPPARLRRVRRQELATALRILGLEKASITSLGIADGGVGSAEAAMGVQLSELLETGDLIVAPWIRDAHPDHDAAGRAAQFAANRRSVRALQYPIWAWHWMDPVAVSSPWASAVRVPIGVQAFDRKHQAIKAFATQTGEIDGLTCEPILPKHVTARFGRSYEVFIA